MGKRPPPNVKVLANQKLVRSLVIAKYGPTAADDEDLYQAGLMGLCLAVDAFERQQVTGRFSSYARTCIISELAKCAQTSGRRIIPHRRYYERIEIQRHVASLAHVLGRVPSTTEILDAWQGSRPPTSAAVIRALEPEPVLLVDHACGDIDHDSDDDSVEIEDLIDAKRRFERLTLAEQEQLTRDHRG